MKQYPRPSRALSALFSSATAKSCARSFAARAALVAALAIAGLFSVQLRTELAVGGFASANTQTPMAVATPTPVLHTKLVSVNAAGTGSGNDASSRPAVSADGRFVAFESKATNLTSTSDTNGASDIFVRDTQTGTTTLVSADTTGTSAGNGASTQPSISADGRFIAFQSTATNLVVTSDTNNASDIFVRDLQTGHTTLASVNSAGTATGDAISKTPVLSANGRVVVFISIATNLTALNYTPKGQDIFARDLQTNTTSLVTINTAGTGGGNDHSAGNTPPVISADGRFIAFDSQASNLAANDANGGGAFGTDVFVRDLQTNTTTLVTVTPSGTGSVMHSFGSDVSISADGRFVGFETGARDLVAGITYSVNAVTNIFVRDLVAGKTTIVSTNPAGTTAGNSSSRYPVLSADGRFVAFDSTASNLVAGFGGDFGGVFLRDLQTGTLAPVSINASGTGGGNSTTGFLPPQISADGRYVLFDSAATNMTLVPDFDNNPELLVRDTQLGITNNVTTNMFGTAAGFAPNGVETYALSANGRAVAFATASNFVVPGDNNHFRDVFLFDNSQPVSVFVGDAQLFEGDAGTTDAVFNFYLSNVAAAPVTISYATTDGTASAPDDYAAVSGTLTFNPGEVAKTVRVPVNGDTQVESDEFFSLVLGQPVNATLGRTQGSGLIINDDPRATFVFSAANFSVNEGDGHATITVKLVGVAPSSPVSVVAITADDQSPVRCDDTVNNHGAAYARCDYATTVETLTFMPGDTEKTFTIPIIDDAHIEGNETVQLVLTNPVGANLGSTSTATLTIVDNDTVSSPNPINSAPFFIRQQYLDFLSREPDTDGFNGWMSLLNSCPDPFNIDPNSPSARCDRVTVSANFFLSVEFRLKGAFAFRFYKLSFARLPLYTEIVTDMRAVTGATQAEVFQKKSDFTNAWVQRQEFKDRYDKLDNAAFVNALMDRYQLASVSTPDPLNPDQGSKVTLARSNLINQLNATTMTRAQVVRAVADSDEVTNAEFTSAFVAMQYYGYLRRTPDAGGYSDWITYLTAHPGDYRTMVVGFINAPEYRLRFGAQ